MDFKDGSVKQEKNDTKFTQKPGEAETGRESTSLNNCSQFPDLNTLAHGQLRLRDLLRFVGDPCREIGLRDGGGLRNVEDVVSSNPTSHQNCAIKEEHYTGNSCTQGARNSLNSEFSATPTIDVSVKDGKRKAPQKVSKLASDNLLPEFFRAPSTSEKEGMSSGLGRRSHSIIAHILTGEDKNLGAGTYSPERNLNLPEAVRYVESSPGSPIDIRSVEDQFIEDTLCEALNVDKLDCQDQWEVETAESVCPVKELKVPALSQQYDNQVASDHDISMCSTLLVQEISERDDLVQDIAMALGTNMIKVVTPQEAMDFCNTEVFCMIWIRVSASSLEEVTSLVSSIRFSSKKNKGAHVIAVLGTKQEDLQLHGFDDVYEVPIPKELIRQKYKNVNWITISETMGADNSVTTRDAVTTPESTISVESVRTSEGSQSSNCDSISSGLEFPELNFPEFKHSHSDNMGSLSDGSDQLMDRSSTLTPQSPPPSWCRAEHASKEKQRRERIKDSCDQLRVLLPYVRGRKTDMASILEMTVDYLKIVNAALPQDFQSQIIEIMSHGGPMLDGKKNDKERMSMACKKISRRETARDTTPPPINQVFFPPSRKLDKSTSAGIVPGPRAVSTSSSQEITATTGNLSNPTGSGVNLECIKPCSSPPAQNPFTNLLLRNTHGVSVLKRARPVEPEDGDAKRSNCTLPKSADASNNPEYLPTAGSVLWEKRRDTGYELSPRDVRPHAPGLQLTHTLTDSDNSAAANRMFPVGHDQYPYQHHTQLNLSIPQVRRPPSDRDVAPYGNLYFDSYYHTYYPPFSEPSNPGYCTSGPCNEYVNPNAVLPVTSFNPRLNSYPPGHKQEERSAAEMDHFRGGESVDLFNLRLGDKTSFVSDKCDVSH